jgi:hypothetical protein
MAIRINNNVAIDDSRQLNVVGVNTIGDVRISSGIITSVNSGIVTYYGDGSKLTGISQGSKSLVYSLIFSI